MGSLVGATELSEALIDNLLKPHSSTGATLSLLNEIESLLSTVEQNPTASVQRALNTLMRGLVSADLLRNPDSDVRVFVVSCLTEIMRITAPEAPYNDDQMKEIFQVTVEAFGKLADASCRSYKKAEAVLETVAKVKSSLVMLDLECDDLVLEMFRQFLNSIRLFHPQLVINSMETVMCTVIDESEEISTDLLEILLTAVKKDNRDVSPMASTLVEKVLRSCASKLQPCIKGALNLKGTSLELYSPVVLSICQSEYASTPALNVVAAKGNGADEKISERQVVSSNSLEDKLDLGHSRKGSRSKRTARGGIRQANEDDKARNGNDMKQLSMQGQSESTDAETESGSKRSRKPNSLMNPEEGYPFKTSSSIKMQGKKLGDSSNGKLAAKKASLLTKVGQTNQSVVISLSSSGKAKMGSRKRSRTKMEEMDNDVVSMATSTSKKQITKKDISEEEDFMESNPEKPDTGIKTAKASNKENAPNGSVKTSAKKPLAETKMVKTSGKKAAHSDSKKKKPEDASMDTPIPQSSKSKKKNSSATTPPVKKSEQTLKSHPKIERAAGKEVESKSDEPGEELVGKRVNVWWPLDQEFYEGVIDSYCISKKTHHVLYVDGDAEELNLRKERFKIIQDNSSASEDKEIDLPESIPLSVLIQRLKVKKNKKVSVNVEPSSSLEVRSSVRTTKNKEPVPDSTKQAKRTKGATKAASNEPESREGKNLKSSKELNGESGRTTGRTRKRQKVTRAIHCESEKDCDEDKDLETEGKDSLKFGKKSNAEPECMGEHQELPGNQDAETKTDGKERKAAKEPNAEPGTDGKERNSLKESNAEPGTDGEEQDAAKEPTAEPRTGEEEQKVAKETSAELEAAVEEQNPLNEKNVEPKTEKSVKEPDAETKTKVEDEESAKEQTADTKMIEQEDISGSG